MIDKNHKTIWTTSLFGAAAAGGVALWVVCRRAFSRKTKIEEFLGGVHPDLKAHSHTFEKQIVCVHGTNVYVAIGYAIANCIMIEGDDGIIIIDTTESITSAKEVLQDFRKITQKKIAGIIQTHFHHDHIGGTEVFARETLEQSTQIWSHETTEDRVAQFNALGPLAFFRASKMFGTCLEHPARENCGIGGFMAGASKDGGLANSPTHTYAGRKSIHIAGVELELIHAPGETDDQTVIFMPKHKILFAADNYYASFPNLYTIRGAPHRDVTQWASSLDTMIETNPDILVPSHTLPVYGADEIRTRLENYRDAIQYVHDQTVRLMLNKYHPDEIAAAIQLPSNLRDCDYLKEFYGTVGWSAKAIFTGYLGWYSGDECDLWKLTPSEYAYRFIDLAGGSASALEKAQESFDKLDFQWALELTTAILRASDKSSRKATAAARELKTQCCIQLAERQINANGRNWYMTSAKVNQEGLQIKMPDKMRKDAILKLPLWQVFNALTVRFNPKKWMEGVRKSVCFVLNDGNEESGWMLTTRNCVMYCSNTIDREADIVVETTEPALRQLFANPASIATSILSKDFVVKKGDITTFLQYVGSIDMYV